MPACGGAVERRFRAADLPPGPAPHPFLICIYRFVQEGLMNAFRHAPGARVSVGAEQGAAGIVIRVQDEGPGFDAARRDRSGLGLAGLRERVESIGGGFGIESRPQGGTHLAMTLPLEPPR